MKPSTRRQTKLTGTYVRSTPAVQSLERGLGLLRAFRLGSTVLTNADLAARTGLPRSTVSRLTLSLVEAGFLSYDHAERGYRLGVICLSLALSYRSAHAALDSALPLMRRLAEGRRINVGLAVLDQTEMVYLDSVRLGRTGMFRRLVPGSRIPVALTALGRAYLSAMPQSDREDLLSRLGAEHGINWLEIRKEVMDALASMELRCYCWAQWQPGAVAIATTVREPSGELYALNLSFQVVEPPTESVVHGHGTLLLELARAVHARWHSDRPSDVA